MRILYVSYDGMTDTLGQSQVIPYLKGLAKKGYQISIVSCEKKVRFIKQGETIASLLKANNIEWFPVSYSSLPSLFSKILNVYKLTRKAKQLHHKYQFQMVHCRSYLAAFSGLLLKRRFGVKFLFDMRGFWADERIDGRIWRLNNPVYRSIYNYFKRKEKQFLKESDAIISLTENGKKEILTWRDLNIPSTKITVIPCCADLSHFSLKSLDDQKIKMIRKETQIKEKDFVLSYLGSVGTWYMLDEMLQFFKRLLLVKTSARLLFITPDDKSIITEAANRLAIDLNKLIILEAKREDVPAYISLSDISIFFIKPAYSKKASSPTKMGEIMGLGIPVITNSGVGDVDGIIEKTGAGVLVKDFTDHDFDKAIGQIDDLLMIDKSSITAAANEYFSLEMGVEKYNEVYGKLMHEIKTTP